MELVKKIILIIIVLFYGCKNSSSIKQLKNNSEKADSIINNTIKQNIIRDVVKPIKSNKSIIGDNSICFIKKKELRKNNKIFTYDNFSLGLSFDVESQMNYLDYRERSNVDRYILEKDDYDQPDFEIKVYVLEDIYIY